MSFIFSFVSYMLAKVKGGIMYFLAPKLLDVATSNLVGI